MREIEGKLFSHLSLRATGGVPVNRPPLFGWEETASDEGLVVHSYAELFDAVAALAYTNRQFELFMRGQAGDWRIGGADSVSSVFSTLLRPASGARLSGAVYEERLRQLAVWQKKIDSLDLPPGYRTLAKYPEALMALVQHYELGATPLLDLTRSVRVASTFATWNAGKGGDRFLLVFGLPYPQGSVTVHTADDLILLHLRSLMPAEALRPHYQEGFLLASWPRETARQPRAHQNLARRMIGKFRIPEADLPTFWQGRPGEPAETPFHQDFLMPKQDPVLAWATGLRDELVAAGALPA